MYVCVCVWEGLSDTHEWALLAGEKRQMCRWSV